MKPKKTWSLEEGDPPVHYVLIFRIFIPGLFESYPSVRGRGGGQMGVCSVVNRDDQGRYGSQTGVVGADTI